ncbi:hypothetical protein B0H14DRAFT_3889917 [Mycena olivaceomarginata]|nr:hypothetical protein B0H14DRAFT_3889917 [Mycena olivaceomarginata]
MVRTSGLQGVYFGLSGWPLVLALCVRDRYRRMLMVSISISKHLPLSLFIKPKPLKPTCMSTESKPLIFVTGAAGYLGFEVVYQLLEAGYSVRGAARGRKIPLLKTALEKYPKFEVVEIADVATADFSAAFESVGAIIHTAAPLPGRTDPKTALKSAIEGSLHILREARKAGIKKVIVTGSIVTFPEDSFGANDWGPEENFGEQAVLDFAEKHPEMDITIFCPPWIFGPFAPGFEHIVPTPDFAAFSTNIFVYHLLRADNHHACRSFRPYDADFRDAIRYISEAHPELRERLADPSTVPAWPRYKLPVDLKPVEEAYSIEHGSYKTWKETILDAGRPFLLDLEKLWKSKGLEFEVPRTWA